MHAHVSFSTVGGGWSAGWPSTHNTPTPRHVRGNGASTARYSGRSPVTRTHQPTEEGKETTRQVLLIFLFPPLLPSFMAVRSSTSSALGSAADVREQPCTMRPSHMRAGPRQGGQAAAETVRSPAERRWVNSNNSNNSSDDGDGHVRKALSAAAAEEVQNARCCALPAASPGDTRCRLLHPVAKEFVSQQRQQQQQDNKHSDALQRPLVT